MKKPTVTIASPVDGLTVSGMVTITVTVNDKEDDLDSIPIIEREWERGCIGFLI